MCLNQIRLSNFTASACILVAITILLSLGMMMEYHIHHPLNIALKGTAGALLVAAATLSNFSTSIKVPRLFLAMGDSSYSLYLSHPFALGITAVLWKKIEILHHFNLWIYVGIAVITAILGAHIACMIIEKPMMNFLKNKRT